MRAADVLQHYWRSLHHLRLLDLLIFDRLKNVGKDPFLGLWSPRGVGLISLIHPTRLLYNFEFSSNIREVLNSCEIEGIKLILCNEGYTEDPWAATDSEIQI